MSIPDNPPPPYSPYDPDQNPYFQHTAPLPAEPAPRRGRRMRGLVAGAVAGGVLAASVAVPVTWALARTDQGGGSSSASATAPQQGTQQGTQQAPSTGDGQQALPQVPDQGGTGSDGGAYGTDPYSQFGQSTSKQEPDATDAQSQGVVLIDSTLTDGEAAGTGLVLSSSGLVLTNYHVVEGSTSLKVTVATTGDTYDATVVGHDADADVALVQLKDASDLATVKVDDDSDPSVADTVTAVGNAEGQGFLSASTGKVVALDQSITTQSSGAAVGEDLKGLIETNAYVVGGYSGGALLDSEGEVVGITTAASSGGVSESYAVPIEDALTVVQAIEDGHEGNGVQIGPSAYLGIGIANTTSLQVASVESGSAAAGAGLQAGDVITTLGGTRITSYAVLKSALASYEPGDKVALGWTDGSGSAHTATVTLGSSPVS